MGSRKGIPNKPRERNIADLAEATASNPLSNLIRLAKLAEAEGDYSVASNNYAKVAKYVHQELKAVEHSGNIDGNQTISVVRYEIIESNDTKPQST